MNREELIKEIDNATGAMRETTRVVNETLCHSRNIKNEETEEAYNKGLEDAWELMKKVINMEMDEKEDVFGVPFYSNLIEGMSPQEALAKFETYEKTKKINVGDVVELADGTKAVVMDKLSEDEDFAVFTENECAEIWNKKSDFKKTGKHIDITSLLEQLRGDKE